jgi:hypothetical protein
MYGSGFISHTKTFVCFEADILRPKVQIPIHAFIKTPCINANHNIQDAVPTCQDMFLYRSYIVILLCGDVLHQQRYFLVTYPSFQDVFAG